MTFGERLIELRGAMPVTELADAAGVSRQTIFRLERDQREPSWSIVMALAEALDVTPDAFLPSGSTARKTRNDRKSR